jgi:uracil phosphoribosyltransferase
MQDAQHLQSHHQLSELTHHYGPNVHILSDVYLLSLLARLCRPDTYQPDINRLVDVIYRHLAGVVVAHEFPRAYAEHQTRMIAYHPEGVFRGELLANDTHAVVVDLARAGMFPSQIVYDHLNIVLDPRNVRQDHIFMNRRSDESGKVVGIDISGSKIGGPIDDAMVVLPDPMGATAGSMVNAIDQYRNLGRARGFIAVHLIVTPEYLKAMRQHHPDAVVYAVRLDRGLSSPDVLQTVPGERWEEERGLNAHHYIVPGGGGFGEIMNNAFV